MEGWVSIAERFGLPVMMLFGAVYGIVKLFNWMANDMMYQIKQNNERFEGIVIKLIDSNRKQTEATMKALETSNQQQEAIRNNLDNNIIEELLSGLISTTLIDLEISTI